MEDCFAEQALTRLPGKKYAQSEAPENISEASSAPREEVEDVDGKAKEVKSHPGSRTQALQAMKAVRGYCAMKTAEKDGEDGKKSISVQPRGHNDRARLWREGYPGCGSYFGCKWLLYSAPVLSAIKSPSRTHQGRQNL